MKKLLLICMVSNLIGAILNCFGTIFSVVGLVIAGGVFIFAALGLAIFCLIKTFC